MSLHGIRKDFQTKREGTLVLFKMKRAIGMWNVLVQKKNGSVLNGILYGGSEKEELIVWGCGF